MNELDIIPLNWNYLIIVLSYVISFASSLFALHAAKRIPRGDNKVNLFAVWSAGVGLGGGAIWYMHFIGMIALSMPEKLNITYDIIITIVSLWAAIIVAVIALIIVGRNPKSIKNLLIAGFLSGCGVVIMHYMGMMAMNMSGYIQWNLNIIAISVGIAIVAATAALWLTFNTKTLIHKILASLVMGIAVCGMHYTGMYAGTFVCTSASTSAGFSVGGAILPYYSFGMGVLLLLLMVVLNNAAKKDIENDDD